MSECIEHGVGADARGYGRLWVMEADGLMYLRLAHRVVFQAYHGYFPEVVMHLCDNPRCINIRHLDAGNAAKNSADKISKGRWARKRLEMRRFTEEQISEIRSRYVPYDRTDGAAAMAREFSVAPTTIVQIVQMRSYYA